MSGPRTDKARAWASLESILQVQAQVCSALARARGEKVNAVNGEDVQRDLANLKSSGRLDRQQIVLIMKLIRSVIRVERNMQ